jgi:hypothetical protein
MGILSTIFGSGKVIEKGLELIDEAWTSDEEAAENAAKVLEAKTNAKTALLTAYAPFKLAQRYIAFTFTLIFAFIMLNGVLGAMYGWISLDQVEEAKNFANKMYLGEIMLAIISFYFGGGFIESLKKRK